jgi:hypothetical protein
MFWLPGVSGLVDWVVECEEDCFEFKGGQAICAFEGGVADE